MSSQQSKAVKILGILAASAGVFYWMWGNPVNRKDLLKRVPRTYCSKIKTSGYYCVSGYVQVDEPLYATRDQIPCAMWEEWEYNRGGGQAIKKGGKQLKFMVNDGTGQVTVDASQAIVDKQKIFFDNSKMSSGNVIRQVKGIEPRAQVTLFGHVEVDGDGKATFVGPGVERYYYIARSSREDIEKEWSGDNFQMTFLKPGLTALGVGFILYVVLIPPGEGGSGGGSRKRRSKKRR